MLLVPYYSYIGRLRALYRLLFACKSPYPCSNPISHFPQTQSHIRTRTRTRIHTHTHTQLMPTPTPTPMSTFTRTRFYNHISILPTIYAPSHHTIHHKTNLRRTCQLQLSLTSENSAKAILKGTSVPYLAKNEQFPLRAELRDLIWPPRHVFQVKSPK